MALIDDFVTQVPTYVQYVGRSTNITTATRHTSGLTEVKHMKCPIVITDFLFPNSVKIIHFLHVSYHNWMLIKFDLFPAESETMVGDALPPTPNSKSTF